MYIGVSMHTHRTAERRDLTDAEKNITKTQAKKTSYTNKLTNTYNK